MVQNILYLTDNDVLTWYQTIKPIGVSPIGIPCFLRSLSDREVFTLSCNWLHQARDYEEPVDFSKLSYLEDIKMLHRIYGTSLPRYSVGEIIRQIPSIFLDKITAFQVVYLNKFSNTNEQAIFPNEFKQGYSVSVVRLYSEKNECNSEAIPITEDLYPYSEATLPLKMTEEEFSKLRSCRII